jgi:hypothetical protein
MSEDPPMASVELTLKREIGAPTDVVFATITDHSAYGDFTPIRRAVLERPGEEAPNGTGAIRALHLVGPPIRERVIAYEEPRLFSYEVLSGVPVRKQVGTVTLADAGPGACEMTYALAIEPLVPFSGPLVGAITRTAIGRLMAGVAKEAEARATAPAAPVA